MAVADASLEAVLTEATRGPLHRLAPGRAGAKLAAKLALRPRTVARRGAALARPPPGAPGGGGRRGRPGPARRPPPGPRRGAARAGELAGVAGGRSELAPPARDRRFKDPAWAENPFYRSLMQTYLAVGR